MRSYYRFLYEFSRKLHVVFPLIDYKEALSPGDASVRLKRQASHESNTVNIEIL